jgi:hypothetical protein
MMVLRLSSVGTHYKKQGEYRKWDCMFAPEPEAINGSIYLTFDCNNIGIQFILPTADFIDERT